MPNCFFRSKIRHCVFTISLTYFYLIPSLLFVCCRKVSLKTQQEPSITICSGLGERNSSSNLFLWWMWIMNLYWRIILNWYSFHFCSSTKWIWWLPLQTRTFKMVPACIVQFKLKSYAVSSIFRELFSILSNF